LAFEFASSSTFSSVVLKKERKEKENIFAGFGFSKVSKGGEGSGCGGGGAPNFFKSSSSGGTKRKNGDDGGLGGGNGERGKKSKGKVSGLVQSLEKYKFLLNEDGSRKASKKQK
jgi:hypothetical protein